MEIVQYKRHMIVIGVYGENIKWKCNVLIKYFAIRIGTGKYTLVN